MFPPVQLLAVVLEDPRHALPPNLRPALMSLRRQSEMPRGHFRLDIDSCKVLLKIRFLIQYNIAPELPPTMSLSESMLSRVNYREKPLPDSPYWLEPRTFHIILMGENDDKSTVDELKKSVVLRFKFAKFCLYLQDNRSGFVQNLPILRSHFEQLHARSVARNG